MTKQRPIKFRAWDKELREMSIPFGLFDIKPFGVSGLMSGKDMTTQDDYIVMQYTGLHDKRGKEIYGENLTDLVSAIIGGILIYGIWNWL